MGKVYDPADVEPVAAAATAGAVAGVAAAPAGPRVYDPSEVEPVPQEKTKQWHAGLLHGAQGASLGTSDKLTGVAAAFFDNPVARAIREKLGIWKPYEVPVATTREGKPLDKPVDDAPKSFVEAYRAGRDSAREDLEQTRQDWGKTALGSELVGGILSPIKAPVLRGGGVIRAAGRAGLEGAAYAAGASTADLTKGEVGQFVKDTATGFGVAGGVGLAAGGTGKILRKGAESVVDNLEQRVLNELAEGGPRSVKDRVRAKLARAGRAILGEVIEGKDADTVRKAMQSPKAESGIKTIKPVIESVGEKLDEGYEAFRAAGKDIKPAAAAAYYNRLMKRASDPAMSAAESKAIEQLADNWRDIVGRHKGTPVDLQRLRKFTTETQEAASAVSSDPSVREKLSVKLSAIATDAMDDMLSRASRGDATLEAAAKLIRENNERMYALKSVETALKSRVAGEASARSNFVRVAEKISTPAAVAGAVGGAGLALSDTDKAIERAGLGIGLAALAKGLPAGARAIDRAITTGAIKTVRAVPAGTAKTVRERLAEKLRVAKQEAKRLERYGRVAGGLAGRAAVDDEEAAP